MSSDGASPKPRPQRPARSGDRSFGQLAMALLLILAVIATVLMVVSESRVWTRVGTLTALWSAFIGAALVTRYRRQASTEATRIRDLHTVYELQLEREISARREHELVIEKQLRESVRHENEDSMLALRQEIAALREQLGRLTGSPLADEATAVGGTRAAEIGAGSPRQTVPSERVEPRPSGYGWTPTGGAESVGGVDRDSTPSSEETSTLPPVSREQDRDPSVDTGGRPAVRPAGSRSGSSPVPGRQDPARPAAATPGSFGSRSYGTSQFEDTGSWQKVPSTRHQDPAPEQVAPPRSEPPRTETTWSEPQWGRGSDTDPAAVSAAAPGPETHTATATSDDRGGSAPSSGGGRRRAEEREPADHHSRHGEGQGNSVADLLARLGTSGDEPSSGGRRHRRADD